MIDALLAARTFDLSQPLQSSIPSAAGVPPFTMAWVARHGDVTAPGGTSFAHELLSIGTHTGTHIDALNHFSCDGRLHGGALAEEARRIGEPDELAVEFVAPLTYRGVLLDIPGLRGVDRLANHEAVTGEDMESACRAQGVEIRAGDAVLVRTGWGARGFYGTDGYYSRQPGVDISGARYLVDRGARLTGGDTSSYELLLGWPSPLAVHEALLVDAGVCIMENMYLDELAMVGAHEFALVIAPLKIIGASGSPLRPLALVA